MLKLAEIFCSLQGESTWAGLPCIFIRLAGCNLRCSYCDTKYAYIEKFKMSSDEVLDEIKKYSPIKLVEITGGEPLLQKGIYELCDKLHNQNYKILLETNGSLFLKNVPKFVHKIVDIKCPSSGESESFKQENLQFLNRETDEIKFVLANRADYDFACKKKSEYNLEGYEILFTTVFKKLPPAKLAKWMIADRLSVRLQLQLHKYIWSPHKKGV
ncbi:MAG: radical SAM protein [Candidatus Cloacimonadota bacterium]|nr:radical SAM protein [Candidatus Cloacimonadota bacterium]